MGHENRRKVRPVPGSKGDHGLAAPRWSAQAKKRAKFELVKTSVGEKKGNFQRLHIDILYITYLLNTQNKYIHVADHCT